MSGKNHMPETRAEPDALAAGTPVAEGRGLVNGDFHVRTHESEAAR